MISEEFREGHYKDKYGRWQPDRRSGKDRRLAQAVESGHERRRNYRRKADRELLECDHRSMIDDALQEFAEGHGGHL